MPVRTMDLDRQTPMFLPYDLRDWVPEGHIVHFILEAVGSIPQGLLRLGHGSGGNTADQPSNDSCYENGNGWILENRWLDQMPGRLLRRSLLPPKKWPEENRESRFSVRQAARPDFSRWEKISEISIAKSEKIADSRESEGQ